MDIIPEDGYDQELKVTFLPELYLQRRIWVLNILRKESVTKVSDPIMNVLLRIIN